VYTTAYSYGTVRDQQQSLAGWVGAVSWGGEGIEQHYLPKRGKAGKAVLSFFA
jgi:hypothetical protein